MLASSPTPDNKAADAAVDAVSAVFSGLQDGIIAAIILEYPVFANSILKAFINQIVKWLLGYFQKQTAIQIVQWVIDVQVNGEKAKAYQACNSLMNILSSGNQDEINQSSKDFDAAYADLVHYDGSTSKLQ